MNRLQRAWVVASAPSTSSGTITLFGSVFVNGHEFATGAARVIDDDAGTTSSDTAASWSLRPLQC